MVAYEHLLTIGRNPDGMLTFLALCTCADPPQHLLVHLMEGSRQSSMNLSVQPPTKIEPIFHPFKEGKFTSVPMFASSRPSLVMRVHMAIAVLGNGWRVGQSAIALCCNSFAAADQTRQYCYFARVRTVRRCPRANGLHPFAGTAFACQP